MEDIFNSLHKLQESLQKDSSNFLHTIRSDLEDPIYTYLHNKYGAFYKDFWNSPNITIPTEAPNTILLVERREHPNIEFVLQNTVYFCQQSGKPFSLTVVCSDANEKRVREILGKHESTTTLLPLFKGIGTRDQGRDEYNHLFLSEDFWNQINADYILSIQTDSYLLRPIPDSFWNYDYIACPWQWNPGFVGGGGLTWRKKEAVLDMIRKLVSKQVWAGEDVFFSEACAALDKKVPEFEDAIQYFVESCLTEEPIGVHQWWTYWFPLQDAEEKKFFFEQYTTLHHSSP